MVLEGALPMMPQTNTVFGGVLTGGRVGLAAGVAVGVLGAGAFFCFVWPKVIKHVEQNTKV